MPGNGVLNPRLFLGEGSLDRAFVISGVRKTKIEIEGILINVIPVRISS